ncbi:hypothetical protein Y032_0089g2232 [Ancylostoma ceylanicum]|uniref:Uncharacterized protein n=1 Tax=Ancylostoma ceylanicum TaxID=53326 RepID=A0A016TN14_9BILA|nr:hypothetical protein Y032_0089g2232 [Ancylostoma ceylanicum]
MGDPARMREYGRRTPDTDDYVVIITPTALTSLQKGNAFGSIPLGMIYAHDVGGNRNSAPSYSAALALSSGEMHTNARRAKRVWWVMITAIAKMPVGAVRWNEPKSWGRQCPILANTCRSVHRWRSCASVPVITYEAVYH